VQLGLRGKTLARYAREWILRIDDVSDFVRAQRERLDASGFDALELPVERVYPCTREAALALGLDVD
jgi:hypothetical protein